MPKPRLAEPYGQLESDIIDTMIAGLKQWRSDLAYPESRSDMQGAVRGLLQMFSVKRRNLPFELPYADCTCGIVEIKSEAPATITAKHRKPDCPVFLEIQLLSRM